MHSLRVWKANRIRRRPAAAGRCVAFTDPEKRQETGEPRWDSPA